MNRTAWTETGQYRPSIAGARALMLALGGIAGMAGCTSPGYKLASKTRAPPIWLNLPSTQPPIEALLHTVIIYHGPGSWKKNAYWDEYVVTVANRGSALVTIESATLIDFHENLNTAGTDPWALEMSSRSAADQGFGLAKGAAVQIGGGLTTMVAGGGIGAVLYSGGFFGAAGGAAIGGILLLPAYVGGTIYTNINGRRAIEREFARRRLVLPVVLVPGQLVQGSLFFRISPGPKRLILKCRVDNEPRDVVIDLTPLAGLHLKTKPGPPATAALLAPQPETEKGPPASPSSASRSDR